MVQLTLENNTLSIELLTKYRLSHGLDFHDALIAATAIYFNIELYTLNIKDFIFIDGLKLYEINHDYESKSN